MLVSSSHPTNSAETLACHTESLATDAAVRLISETAHDLRAPLTAVRESIRLVRDGDLGRINDDQENCLDSAVDQCCCIEQMVGEMVQLERLRTGTPRVYRQAVSVAEIRREVDDTLRPWTVPRRINLLWDGDDDAGMLVYADHAMLRRLLVNLATNAIRASAEGGFVLIRMARVRHGETVRWSVVDRGRGISEQELLRVADREFSCADGEGLGLAISRQLAALHFSPLRIRSRLAKGTEVNFETAACSPRSLAGAWVRWRMSFATTERSRSTGREGSIEWTSQGGDRKIRLDAPTVSVTLTHAASRPRHASCFASGFVSLGGTVSRSAADQFDAVLQSQLQMFDLAYRADTRRWVWCLDANQETILDRVAAISEVLAERIPGIRMKWSRPQVIRLDTQRTVWQLSDLLVRQSLSGTSATRGMDCDEVRPGTEPIAPSAIAAARLDAEVRRLSADFRLTSSL